MISDGNGNIRWCSRCERRAAENYCEAWLCGECYQATHQRTKAEVESHINPDERESSNQETRSIGEIDSTNATGSTA